MTFSIDPRLTADTLVIGELPLSRLLLMDDARWPWLILVPRIAGARELIDLDGNDIVLEGDGLLAQALQHETDHLDGMLYLSRLSPADRKMAMREVRESSWF